MNAVKLLTLTALISISLFLIACPGGESGDSIATESPAIDSISESSALEDADKILKEIEEL